MSVRQQPLISHTLTPFFITQSNTFHQTLWLCVYYFILINLNLYTVVIVVMKTSFQDDKKKKKKKDKKREYVHDSVVITQAGKWNKTFIICLTVLGCLCLASQWERTACLCAFNTLTFYQIGVCVCVCFVWQTYIAVDSMTAVIIFLSSCQTNECIYCL